MALLQMQVPQEFDPLTGSTGSLPAGCKVNIGHVRNQGLCGSCWAQAVVGVLNDRLCIKSGGAMVTSLSTADVTACDGANMGCNGGWPSGSVNGYMTQQGVPTD